MIRNFDTSFRGEGARTVYDSISANFVISDGFVQNDDLLLDAPWGGVEGAGTVDLGARTVDYRVIPGVMRDADGQAGIAVPILISGPWSDLSFRPDLEYLAEQEFLEQRDRLAAEAEARLAEEQDRLEQDMRDRANDFWAPRSRPGIRGRISRTPCRTACRRRRRTCCRASSAVPAMPMRRQANDFSRFSGALLVALPLAAVARIGGCGPRRAPRPGSIPARRPRCGR
jgi:hypothetical protein